MAQDVQDSGLGPGVTKIKTEVIDEEVDLKPDIIKLENSNAEDGDQKIPISIKSEPEVKIKTEPKESWVEIEVEAPPVYYEGPSTSGDMPTMKTEHSEQDVGGNSTKDGDSTIRSETRTREGTEQSHPGDTNIISAEKTVSPKSSLSSLDRYHLAKKSGSHLKERPFTCDICGHKFNNRDHLSCHLRIHTGEKPFSCNYCDHKTAYKSALTKHIRIHTGEIFISCDKCDFKCIQRRQLLHHLSTHKKFEPIFCSVCGYKCKAKNTYTRHMLTHSEKKYVCNICDFKTVYKSTLVTHISRNHTSEKPFSCNLCDKYKTNIQSDLNRHMKTHTESTNDKRFCCDICGYKCKRKVHLGYHMLTHTGQKPFSCNVCDYKAAQKNTLTAHLRTHTGEKPFSCHVCDYKCKQKAHLKKHLFNHHRIT